MRQRVTAAEGRPVSSFSATVHQRRLPPELRTAQAADGLAAILDALAAHLRQTTPEERTP